MYYLIEKDRVYDTEQMKFIPKLPDDTPPEEISILYMDLRDPENLILADNAFLRKVLLSIGVPIGPELHTIEDEIQLITDKLTDLDAKYLTLRILSDLYMGDGYAQTRRAQHENEAAPLRERLRQLQQQQEESKESI